MTGIKKTTIGILSALICALSLSACSSNVKPGHSHPDKTSSETSSTEEYKKEELTDEQITLVVWESAGGPDKWIKQAGEKFTEIYPNIKIEFYEADIANTFYMVRTGDHELPTPDLFGAPHDRLAQMVESDVILPTRDYETVTTNTLSTAYSALFLGDTMYGYPTSCETYALFYNKSLLSADDIPGTWNAMLTFSENFPKLFPEKYGFLFQCNSIYYLSMLMSQDNNQLMRDGQTGLITESAVDGAELFKKFVPFFPENAIKMVLTDYEELFLNGDAAIIVDGPWFIPQAENSKINFGIASLPAFTEEGSPALSLSGVRGMFVYSKSEHPVEAAAFAKFLTTEEMQKLRLQLTGALPASNISIDNEITYSFLEQLMHSYSLPNTAEMKNFWGYSQQFCEELYEGADASEALAKYDQYIRTGSTEGYTLVPREADSLETVQTDASDTQAPYSEGEIIAE